MIREEKNLSLKDTSSPPPNFSRISGEEQGGGLSYTKTQKLITALYMVTDIIDKEEPLRNKLRTLGTGIISDTYLIQFNNTGNTVSFILSKISEIISFLDLASTVNIISEMNCNILKKEFLVLNESIKESNNIETPNKQINLAEFFNYSARQDLAESLSTPAFSHPSRGERNSIGHTRIGVQKGSTLLKAIKNMSNKMPAPIVPPWRDRSGVFDILKKQRRDNITNLIKGFNNGATIKDIKDKIKTTPEQASFLVSCSEKTLQRELVSMVRDGVLYKTGEKRWSRYFIK